MYIVYLTFFMRGIFMSKEDEEIQGEEMSCCGKTKIRTEELKKSLIHRLNRIEGQVRGLRGMLERNAYCPNILIQASAANAALNAFCRELLSEHIKTCVADDLKAGKTETVDELLDTIQRMLK